MDRLSAIDAVSPAFERTKAMLFQPVRLRTWLKIGFIGWLAGGAAFSGNFNYNMRPPASGGQADRSVEEVERIVRVFVSEHWRLIAVGVALAIAVGLVLVYLSCRFRFILFDSVLRQDPRIERGWTLYRRPAHRFLAFVIAVLCLSLALLFVVVGLPLWRAYKSGIFRGDNPLPEMLRVFAVAFVGILLFVLATAVVSTLARDFVVPLLALDDLTLGGAGLALKQMIFADPGAFAGYLGMKFVLSIGAGIIVTIALVAVFIVLLIPGVILALLAVVVVKAVGASGALLGIFLIAIGSLAAVTLAILVTLLAAAPVSVFFTAYALYFFGGRYPKLGELVSPEPAPPAPPSSAFGSPAPPAPV